MYRLYKHDKDPLAVAYSRRRALLSQPAEGLPALHLDGRDEAHDDEAEAPAGGSSLWSRVVSSVLPASRRGRSLQETEARARRHAERQRRLDAHAMQHLPSMSWRELLDAAQQDEELAQALLHPSMRGGSAGAHASPAAREATRRLMQAASNVLGAPPPPPPAPVTSLYDGYVITNLASTGQDA